MAGRGFSLGTPVSSTNKTDYHDITEILLKVALNTINPNLIQLGLLYMVTYFANKASVLALVYIYITEVNLTIF